MGAETAVQCTSNRCVACPTGSRAPPPPGPSPSLPSPTWLVGHAQRQVLAHVDGRGQLQQRGEARGGWGGAGQSLRQSQLAPNPALGAALTPVSSWEGPLL